MKNEICEGRVKKLIEVLKKNEIDGYLCGLSENAYYFSNFYGTGKERFHGLFIPSVGDIVFLIAGLNETFVRNSTWIDNIITWNEGEDPFEKIASIIKKRKLSMSKIAVDDVLRSDQLLALQEKLPQVKFISGGEFTSALRRIKSNDEKDLMMHLGSIQDKATKNAISAIQVGVSEREIADIIENTFKEFGAKYAGVTPNVASGFYSTNPHHYALSEKLIEDGDSVILDFTGEWKHYKSDSTRTVFVGNPPKEYLKIYNTVKKAQEMAVKSVKPGRTCEEIDRIARKIIEDEGYGQYFIHRTGHGIGLEIHEEPYITEGNKLVLEPGMTFSVEPGIYFPPKYGVRIEDIVIVTEKGAEPFTNLSHDLVIK